MRVRLIALSQNEPLKTVCEILQSGEFNFEPKGEIPLGEKIIDDFTLAEKALYCAWKHFEQQCDELAGCSDRGESYGFTREMGSVCRDLFWATMRDHLLVTKPEVRSFGLAKGFKIVSVPPKPNRAPSPDNGMCLVVITDKNK